MADLLGYAASCAVLATFLMRTMTPLRLIAILSNVLFLAYGYVQHIYPVFFLHMALLPINLWRIFLVQAGPSVQRRVLGAISASAIGSRPYTFWFVVGLLAGLVGPFPVLLMVDRSKANMHTVPFAVRPPPSKSSPSSQAPSPDQPGFLIDSRIGVSTRAFSVFLQDRRKMWMAAGTACRGARAVSLEETKVDDVRGFHPLESATPSASST